jgi:hypothetical protein
VSNAKSGSSLMKSRTPRIVATWLVLGAAAALAGGRASNAASANDAASEPAETRMFARKVNLRRSDVPGFKVVARTQEEHKAPAGPLPRRVEECDGGPLVNGTSRGIASPLLQKQNVPIQTVLSAVYSMRSPPVASAYITAADREGGLGCLQREEIRKRTGLGRLARERIEVSALRPLLGGAPVSGVRVWRCLSDSKPCKSRSDRSFTDRLWFAAGPYVVLLVYIAGPRNEAKTPEPVALPVERRIIALLYRRAQEHEPCPSDLGAPDRCPQGSY